MPAARGGEHVGNLLVHEIFATDVCTVVGFGHAADGGEPQRSSATELLNGRLQLFKQCFDLRRAGVVPSKPGVVSVHQQPRVQVRTAANFLVAADQQLEQCARSGVVSGSQVAKLDQQVLGVAHLGGHAAVLHHESDQLSVGDHHRAWRALEAAERAATEDLRLHCATALEAFLAALAALRLALYLASARFLASEREYFFSHSTSQSWRFTDLALTARLSSRAYLRQCASAGALDDRRSM